MKIGVRLCYFARILRDKRLSEAVVRLPGCQPWQPPYPNRNFAQLVKTLAEIFSLKSTSPARRFFHISRGESASRRSLGKLLLRHCLLTAAAVAAAVAAATAAAATAAARSRDGAQGR